MPTSVRVAVIVMSVLAGLLLLVTAVNLYVLDEFTTRIATEQNIPRADAQRGILLLLGPYLVLGLIFALAAWFVPRRHAWARWLGLAAAALIAMLQLLAAVTGGGLTVLSLLLFVLALATISSLLARTTSAWVPRLRSRD
jgi:uncharacterized protein YggT (Ycf19 family)